LIYRASIPSTISATEPIASWAAGSDPVFAAGWTALTPLNDPAYVLPNAYANDESAGANAYPGFAFNGFQLPNASNADMTLGIVIYTMDNLNSSTGTEDAIAFDKISLIPSAFGADALPQTYDECLRECEFYYEKSYPAGVLPGSNTFSGIRYSTNPLGGDYSSTVLYKTTFNLVFNQVKRNLATVTFYDVAGNLNTVRLGTYDGAIYPVPDAGNNPSNEAISQWDVETNTPSGILLKPIGTSAVMTFNAVPGSKQGEIFYHYVADARIGR